MKNKILWKINFIEMIAVFEYLQMQEYSAKNANVPIKF